MSDKYSNTSHNGSVNQTYQQAMNGALAGAVIQPGVHASVGHHPATSGTLPDQRYYGLPQQYQQYQNSGENMFSQSYTYGKSKNIRIER